MFFNKKKSSEKGLTDKLNYGLFIAPNVILMKDGSLMAGFTYSGPDIEASSQNELDYIAVRLNAALCDLDDGWCIDFQSICTQVKDYPAFGDFPDPTSFVLDEERRQQYVSEDFHYETMHYVILTYKLPPDSEARLQQMLTVGNERSTTSWDQHIKSFEDRLMVFSNKLKSCLDVIRLDDTKMIRLINYWAWFNFGLIWVTKSIGIHRQSE